MSSTVQLVAVRGLRIWALNHWAVLVLHCKKFTAEPMTRISVARDVGFTISLGKFWEGDRAEGINEIRRRAKSQPVTILYLRCLSV